MIKQEYIDILDHFYDFDNGFIFNKMRTTFHHNETIKSPHHMENDVWSHTMLCLNHFFNCNYKEYLDRDIPLSIVIAILCHDIGKCFTLDTGKRKQNTFYNHAYRSIPKTIEFLLYLKDKMNFHSFDTVMNLVLPAVSNHLNLYNKMKYKTLLFNNNPNLYEVSTQVALCDSMGSICLDRKFDNVEYGIKETNKHERNCYVFCGLPGSGKDYLAEQFEYPIFSFDNERINALKENVDCSDMDEKELYMKAFTYCNENKIDLMKRMRKSIAKVSGDICICNTNLTSKARKSLINSLGKFNYHCKYVICDFNVVLERDKNRSGKTVGYNVINRMNKNQIIPTLREGFDSVEIVLN